MRLFRHKKRGSLYEIVAFAQMEADQQRVVVYREFLGFPVTYPDTPPPTTWVRPQSEFFDGRFEELDTEAIAKWIKREAPVWVSPI